MSGVKNFNYDLNKKPGSTLINKNEELKSNPVGVAYESNVKQRAGKTFEEFAPGVNEVCPAWPGSSPTC